MSDKFVSLSIEVVAPPNWFLSVAPLSVQVVPGAPAVFQVTATAQGGYTGDIVLSAIGLPAGVTATITPAHISQVGTATVSVLIPANYALGMISFQLKGTSTP